MNAFRIICKATYNHLRTPKYKIERFDAGWYQIRKALADGKLGEDLFGVLEKANKNLGEKIEKGIYEFGFLEK